MFNLQVANVWIDNFSGSLILLSDALQEQNLTVEAMNFTISNYNGFLSFVFSPEGTNQNIDFKATNFAINNFYGYLAVFVSNMVSQDLYLEAANFTITDSSLKFYTIYLSVILRGSDFPSS